MGTPFYEDVKGKQFGNLIALSYKGKSVWSCGCKCGNFKNVKLHDLKRGKIKSCGHTCKFYGKFLNLKGLTFGKLLVLDFANEKVGTHKIWICRCYCGTIIKVSSNHLRKGGVKSCGCQIRNSLDFIGKRFGKLLVVKRIDKKANNGAALYECKCDCGNIKLISSSNLVPNRTKSCGQCNIRSERLFLEGQ